MSTSVSQSPLALEDRCRPESYFIRNGYVERAVLRRDGTQSVTALRLPEEAIDTSDASAAFDSAFLRASKPSSATVGSREIVVVDLFCGVGGTSLGIREACYALGKDLRVECSVDLDRSALDVFSANFPRGARESLDLSGLSSVLGSTRTPVELQLEHLVTSDVDVLVAGPPCQGHSNLNNHTRRNDPKNELYFKVVRAVELLKPKFLLIENVPSVTKDKGNCVQRSADALNKLGYRVSHGVVDTLRLGVAQTRKRHILAAIHRDADSFDRGNWSVTGLMDDFDVRTRDLHWAIGDLHGIESDEFRDKVLGVTEETQRRIEYLFDNDLYDLPDSERPECHRDRDHTYPSVYGRLRWDTPSPTITGGFYTMGQGRFVHPARRSTLTAHEAARIQFFPDWFDWRATKTRSSISQAIGNAVPPKLSYIFGIEFLR